MILFWSEVICLALTWWFGFVISYVAITQIPEYNDPMRMGYVPYTMAWCFISGFLASGCSFPHLMVFDTSSDTILYLQTLREMQEDEAERENEELAGAFGTTGYLGLLQDIASSAMRCAIPWVKMRQNEFAVLQWNVVFFWETIHTETALWLSSTHCFDLELWLKLKRCGLRQHTAQLAVVKLCVKASKRALKLLVSPL